jgi:replication factor C subunit 2/4
LQVIEQEKIAYDESGIEALLFTAEGDMRNALNNLQSTFAGFGLVTADNVFRVCDQPHPRAVEELLSACVAGRVAPAMDSMTQLWTLGYSALDIITTVFKVLKAHTIPENIKLEMIQAVSSVHMRIADGVGTLLQLHGLVARLSDIVAKPKN